MQIGKTEEINISRSESNFDKACDSAYSMALNIFGINEDGHSLKLQEWERASCCIELSFVTYYRIGYSHTYTFSAKAIKNL